MTIQLVSTSDIEQFIIARVNSNPLVIEDGCELTSIGITPLAEVDPADGSNWSAGNYNGVGVEHGDAVYEAVTEAKRLFNLGPEQDTP